MNPECRILPARHPMKSPAPAVTVALIVAATFRLAAAPPEPRFRVVNVDTNIAIGYGLAIADVDGDKRPDIILCDRTQIVWYRNPSWEKFVIAEHLTAADNVCVAAADIDGDGKAEIAVGAGWNPGDTKTSGALFRLVAPADRTQKWEAIPLPHDPTIHRIRWVKDQKGRMTLLSVPLHGVGNDPAKGEGEGVKIKRYVPPVSPGGEWTVEVVNGDYHKTHNFDPVRWDNDPVQGFLLAAKEGGFVVNYSPETKGYVAESLTGGENGGLGEIRSGSFGGGRHFVAAISPMHGNQVVLLTQPTPGGLWQRRLLDDTLIDGHALACGDLLGIGQDQIVVGWRAMNRPGVKVGIKLLTPLDEDGREWRTTMVDDNQMACEDLQLADLDGDGRPDIIAAGRATKNVKIYFNLKP